MGGAAQEIVVELPDMVRMAEGATNWLITKIAFTRTAGAGANYTFRLGSAAAFVAGSANEVIVYGALAVGTRINDVYAQPIGIRSDANNRIYFRPGWDAAGDNQATVEIWLEPVAGNTDDGTV